MAQPQVTEEAVLSALRTVKDPELHKDLVTLGMIRDVTLDGGAVSFTVVLTTPACPLKSTIEKDVRAALATIPSITEVSLAWGSDVKKGFLGGGKAEIPGVRNIIVVGSGKGGVGKTTVAVNITCALAQLGAKVGLLDADVYGPNVPLMMGLAKGTSSGVRDNRIIPVQQHGIQIMSMGFFVKEGEPVIWRGPMLHGVMKQFLQEVAWEDLDYLIIDLPPGTGDVQLSLTQLIPITGAVVVSTPQTVAWQDAEKAVGMFLKMKVPVMGLIENMSYFICPKCGEESRIFDHGGVRRAAERYRLPFLGEIPLDTRIRVGGDTGRPIVVEYPDAPETTTIRSVAENLAAVVSIKAHEIAEAERAKPKPFAVISATAPTTH